MVELSNENDLNITPKLAENKNNRFGKSPINMPTLSKMINRKVNNHIIKKSQNMQRERDQLFLDYHRNSINNVNNYRTNLPNIITSLTPIEKRNNYKRISVVPKNKSTHGNKNSYISRNFDLSMLNYYNTDNINFFQNDQLNNTFNLKKFKKVNNNKYNENDNDINMSQILSNKNKNNIYMGSNNLYSRNIENKNNLNSNYITQNNINTSNKSNNYNRKLKFTLNKNNLMHTIKKPSKINLEKKNFKYKIPLDMINNYNYGKKKILNEMMESGQVQGNSRKLNIKQRTNKSANKDIIDCSNIDIQNNEKEEMNINNSKDFIKSTIIAFNGLVSQAQELGQILIDNKEMMNTNDKNELNSSNFKDNINDMNMNINNLNVKSKLNELKQEINNEHKTVEELQKINSDLNNKINLFNENTQQYENKVKELVTVINQIKNTNNNPSNSNSNSDNCSNGLGNNNILRKDSNNNFMLENKPKKKKLKFGFVETIFMKDDKFEVLLKPKLPHYDISNKESLMINKTKPKLIFVNVNKDRSGNDGKEKEKNKANEEEYLDAASQMANHIIIESLISMENED